MRIHKISDMKGGWFIGNFVPSILQTESFEVAVKKHKQGEDWGAHYQALATEYNVLVEGLMEMEGGSKTYSIWPGDIFIVEPGEVMKPHFLTNCTVVCVKVPSIPNDKVIA